MRAWFTDTATKSKPAKAAAALSSPIKKLFQSFMLRPSWVMSPALGSSAETRCKRACSPALKPAMFFAAIRRRSISALAMADSLWTTAPSMGAGYSCIVQRGQKQRFGLARHAKKIPCHSGRVSTKSAQKRGVQSGYLSSDVRSRGTDRDKSHQCGSGHRYHPAANDRRQRGHHRERGRRERDPGGDWNHQPA